MRKTRIIRTIGPAYENADVLEKMCENSMNVARLNFLHGTHNEHHTKINLIKKVRVKLKLPIPIMLGTKGTEYRIKTFKNKAHDIMCTVTAGGEMSDRSVPVSFKKEVAL